jgi:uncharacterized membrane protein
LAARILKALRPCASSLHRRDDRTETQFVDVQEEEQMRSIKSFFSRLLVVLAATAFSCPAFAAYDFVSIDYPGAANTGNRGINNAGTVVGIAFDADNSNHIAYSYDSKKGTFTTLTPAPGSLETDALGINERGEIVGQTSDDGVTFRAYIRSKKGVYTSFSHPGSSYTQFRANNNHGLVAGFYVDDATDTFNGLIYDTGNNTFIDILPGLDGFNTGSGVNNQGQVVGSVALPAGVACTGCVAGVYGWLRAPSGAMSFFQVNGAKTRARGITDSGVITGFVDTGPGGAAAGFVTRLTGSASYESITIPAAQLLVADPAAFVTIPEAINDAGTVVGGWNTAGGNSRGFIATPRHGK